METMQKTDHKLMKVECDPSCGFMIRTHDKNELISTVKNHVKNSHNKSMTDKEVMSSMKMA